MIESRSVLAWSQENFGGMTEIFGTLIVVVNIKGDAFVQAHQTLHLKWFHFIVCILYLDIGDF